MKQDQKYKKQNKKELLILKEEEEGKRMSTTKESEVEADGYEMKLSGRDYLREQNVAH